MKVRPRAVGGPRSGLFVAGLDALDGPVLRLTKYTPTVPPVHLGGWDKYMHLGFLKGFRHRRAIEAAPMPAAITQVRHRA